MLIFYLAFVSYFISFAQGNNDNEDVVENNSYSERIQNALVGFVVGWLLAISSLIFLYTLERQAVKYSNMIQRCQISTRTIANIDVIEENFVSQPIFVRGNILINDLGTSSSNMHDEVTGYKCELRQRPILLQRKVEVYQWVEIEKKEEKRTVYSYKKEWCESDQNSDYFKESHYHQNPPREPSIYSYVYKTPFPVQIGSYILSDQQLDKLCKYIPCTISKSQENSLTRFIDKNPQVCHYNNTDYLFYNGDISSPNVGTMRVCYRAIAENGEVSTIGVLCENHSFRPFTNSDAHASQPWLIAYILNLFSCNCCNVSVESTDDDEKGNASVESSDTTCCQESCCCCGCAMVLGICVGIINKITGFVVGDEVLLLEERLTSVGTMFRDENSNLKFRLYLMRFIGCLVLSFGIYNIFNPIATMLSFIPYVSGLLSQLFFLVSIILGFTLGSFTIAFAWILHRPSHMLGKYMLVYFLVMHLYTLSHTSI